jgi:hypothetical protein
MARHKMGKKKSVSGKKKAAPRRRRRVGAASGSIETLAMNGAAVGTGIVAAREVSILLGTFMPSLQASPILTGLGQVAIGGFAAWKFNNGFVRYAGLGMVGNGIMTVLNGAGVIGAAPQTMAYNFVNRREMGDPRLQFVAGPTTRIGSYPNQFGLVAGAGGRKKRYVS